MNSKDISARFKELNVNNTILCSKSELEEFIIYGILFKSNNGYITKNGQFINVNILKESAQRFNINLSNLILSCEQLAKEYKTNKIYCMTQKCYDKYSKQGLIIHINNNDYYRIFDKELWLIYKI